ncbi:MAG TPA: zinc ribbon domain-containing protein [Ktedonobacteraceae bacterium]|nr:zinc ribbon domain-containing protein [Ktedonobacteraceae bacterium]
MFCSHCGMHVQDGDHFCNNCGAPLQQEGGVMQAPYPPMPGTPPSVPQVAPQGRRRAANKPKDPYKDQIAQLRLQLRQLKLQLRQLNNQISGTRSNYFEFDSFMQRGPLHNIGRMVEGAQLFGPYQQRKQLRDQIMQLEQQLLSLEQAQAQWKLEQQNS